MICQRVYNKMNKTNKQKGSQSARTPDKMRILLKKRTHNKYPFDQPASQSLSRLIPGSSKSIIQVNVGQNMDQLRDYVKNRMKTEYADRFQGGQTIIRQFAPVNRAQSSANAQRPSMRNLINSSGMETTRTAVNTSRSALRITNQSAPRQTQQIREKSRQYATIGDIEARIQQLTDTRIRQCLSFTNKKDWTLESQMNILIDALKHLKEQQSPQNPQKDAQQVEKKIELLEKLMAQKMAESEIMKKYYLSKIGKSVHRRYKTIESSWRDQVAFKSKADEHKKHTMVSSSTNNQQFYRRPERSAYNKFRHMSSFYDCDKHKQPMPRSSYKRQYLVYGLSPVLSSKPIENRQARGSSSCKALNSSYQENFGPKRSEKIDIKQLDAYRDKFRNLPISFMNKKDSEPAAKLASYIQSNKQQTIQNKQKYQTVPYLSKYLQSQAHRQFCTDPQMATAAIKHKNLHKLKYEYRKKIHL